MIGSYAKMIEDNLITLQDVPEVCKAAVLKYKKETVDVVDNTVTIDEPQVPYGSIFLPPIELSVSTYDIRASITTADIFKGMLNGNPMPEGVKYTLGLVENTYRKFETTPDVKLMNTDIGFDLSVNGRVVNIHSNLRILRVDINITSSNYEDMLQTIYLIAK